MDIVEVAILAQLRVDKIRNPGHEEKMYMCYDEGLDTSGFQEDSYSYHLLLPKWPPDTASCFTTPNEAIFQRLVLDRLPLYRSDPSSD